MSKSFRGCRKGTESGRDSTRECDTMPSANTDSAAKSNASNTTLDDTLEQATAVLVHEKPNVPTGVKALSFDPSLRSPPATSGLYLIR